MMHSIRPHKLLTLASGEVTLPIPNRRGGQVGAPSLLETFLLVSALRLVKARSIFEFGTCRGATAYHFAKNSEARIYTIDLDHQKPDRNQSDMRYTDIALEGKLDFAGTKYSDRITVLKGDSTRFDYSPYTGKMDMVFVDGGHDYDTVRSDTDTAFTLVQGQPSACIAWHDYREPLHSGITFHLDNLAENGTELFHVEDTVLCFWFSEDAGKRLLG